MTPQEAQFLLAARRPDATGTPDPRTAEALQLAETDPTLREWLRRERAFDRAIAQRLGSVAAPPGLRSRILAGQHATPRPVSWFAPERLALAAAVAVLIVAGAFLLLRPSMATPDRLVADMARFLDHDWDHTFDRTGSRYPELREWLAASPNAIHLDVSDALAGSPTFGCKVFSWRGHRATLVCFQVAAARATIHVISLPHEALPDFTETSPLLAASGGWATATWKRGPRIYVALTTAPPETLARWL